jgi:hypothetical protein
MEKKEMMKQKEMMKKKEEMMKQKEKDMTPGKGGKGNPKPVGKKK